MQHEGRAIHRGRPAFVVILRNTAESLDPLVPSRAMVKALMTCRQLAGLLASGALDSADLDSKDLVNNGEILLVLFKRTPDDARFFFV
jgi:hypothetical protein